MRLKNFLFLIILTFSTSLLASQFKAHVHGNLKMEFAVDKREFLLIINTSSDSLLGFEHKARTKEEIVKVEMVKNQFENHILKYLGKNILRDCKVVSSKWDQQFSGKSHSNILHETLVKCDKDLRGRKLNISLRKHFNHIQNITYQVLRSDGSVHKMRSAKKISSIKL